MALQAVQHKVRHRTDRDGVHNEELCDGGGAEGHVERVQSGGAAAAGARIPHRQQRLPHHRAGQQLVGLSV